MADTPVHFDFKAGDHDTRPEGSIWINVAYRVHVSGNDDYIAVTDAIEYPLVDGAVEIDLRPTNSLWAYKITEDLPGGITRYVAVPTASSVQYGDLVDVNPNTLIPTTTTQSMWDYTTGIVQGLYDQTRIARDNTLAVLPQMVTSGTVTGDNLVLTTQGGSTIVAGNVRGPAATGSYASLYLVGTQTVPITTTTFVPLTNAGANDDATRYNTTTPANGLQVLKSGLYLVSWWMYCAAGGTASSRTAYVVNTNGGTTIAEAGVFNGAAQIRISASRVTRINANDTIRLMAYFGSVGDISGTLVKDTGLSVAYLGA